MVRSAGEEQFAGCTGFPADSHNVLWLMVSYGRPPLRGKKGAPLTPKHNSR